MKVRYDINLEVVGVLSPDVIVKGKIKSDIIGVLGSGTDFVELIDSDTESVDF